MYLCYFNYYLEKERLHSFRIFITLQNVLILESNLQLLLVCLNFDWMSLVFASITLALSFYFIFFNICSRSGYIQFFFFLFFPVLNVFVVKPRTPWLVNHARKQILHCLYHNNNWWNNNAVANCFPEDKRMYWIQWSDGRLAVDLTR